MPEFEKDEIRNFKYVQMCLHLTHDALNELKILCQTRPVAEVKFIMHGPLRKYAIALQYMFVLEYTKLFEKKKKGGSSNHLASLEKLSFAILDKFGTGYEDTHEKVINKIDEIRSTELFKLILNLRDSKYAHIDSKQKDPFSIQALTEDQINEAFKHLSLVKQINHYCTGTFGYEFIFDHADNRTDNFIKFQTQYQEKHFKSLWGGSKG